jgi:ribokinase
MNSVVVVGSVNVDIMARVRNLPAPGQTLLGSDAVIQPGGKGANQAVAAARLGAPTRMIAAVGDDDFGTRMAANLADAGVDIAGVTRMTGAATGLALIVVAADGENTVVVAPGANARLEPVGDLSFGRDDVLLLQLEVPVDTCRAAADSATRAGARVVLNAAPLVAPGPALAELLERVDVLVLNESEAAELDGAAELAGAARGAQRVEGWRALAARLPARRCVITLGGQGAVAFDGTDTWWQPAFPASIVDTTGAGDAFCGALAQSLAAGLDLREAVRRGCAAGAFATGRLGAQAALPRADDLAAVLEDARGT